MIRFFAFGQRQSGGVSLIANALGRAWALSANFVVFPIYLRLMGRENFGIIAILASITAIVGLLDLGLTPVFSRQVHHQGRSHQDRVDLLCSTEVVFSVLLAAVVVAVWVVPDSVVAGLVKTSGDGRHIAQVLRWAFMVALVQLPLSFYVSAMLAIEAQVQGNLLFVGISMLRSLGIIVPLLIWPTMDVFLSWQFVVTLLGVLLTRHVLYKLLSAGQPISRGRFSMREIREHLPAAGASLLLGMAATLNMNVDKLFVGKLEGLAHVAEYSVSATFAQLIFIASVPITMTVIPRMVRAITGNDARAFEHLLMIARTAIGVATAMLTVICFRHGSMLIQMWTGGRVASESVTNYLPWLFMGSGCLAVSAIYHCVATAHLDFSFGRAYVVSLLVVIPAYWMSIKVAGAHGAAIAWGCAQLLIMLAYMSWVTWRHLRKWVLRSFPALGLALGGVCATAASISMGGWVESAHDLLVFVMLIGCELLLASVLAVACLAALHRTRLVDDPLASSIHSLIRRAAHLRSNL